jgi:hypothetical protein
MTEVAANSSDLKNASSKSGFHYLPLFLPKKEKQLRRPRVILEKLSK